MEEFKGDKRTRAYRDWKAKQEKESKGLGDTVEKVLEKTGVAKVAKFILGEDCGCDSRKELLNRMFPYEKPNCLTEDEYDYLANFFGERRATITSEQQKSLVNIYNRVFNDNVKGTSCAPCFVNSILKKLEKVYRKYK